MSRRLKRNILIVCEGQVTEPDYFARIRAVSIERGIWDFIEIKPKPRSEDESVDRPSPHKSPRTRRQLKSASVSPEADETEERFTWRSTPVCFVKEARDGLKDDTFQEVWAVFDKNGHPAHRDAFQLALEPVNGKQANIAFSSIAFEEWILLHYEKNRTEFAKSACKNENGRYLGCGNGDHHNDCRGDRCIEGYMRVKRYLSGSTKTLDNSLGTFLNDLVKRREIAYENAAWLRYFNGQKNIAIYEQNPFTNVDHLVKRLSGEDDQSCEWTKMNMEIVWNSLEITVKIIDQSCRLSIQNLGSKTRLLNNSDIHVIIRDDTDDSMSFPELNERKAIVPMDCHALVIGNSDELRGKTLKIRSGNSILFIPI